MLSFRAFVLLGVKGLWVLTCGLVAMSCQGAKEAAIEDLEAETVLAEYQLMSVTGRRDGDILPARIVFEAPLTKLQLDLTFRIGVPTELESGEYRWDQRGETLRGRVRARSVTFLGGQSDHPNLGGVFELLLGDGSPSHRVRIPTWEVTPSNSEAPSLTPSH